MQDVWKHGLARVYLHPNTEYMTTTNIIDSYVLNGAADLLSTAMRFYGLVVRRYVANGICSRLEIEDYSLSIDEHAEAVHDLLNSSKYNVMVGKNKIVIAIK